MFKVDRKCMRGMSNVYEIGTKLDTSFSRVPFRVYNTES